MEPGYSTILRRPLDFTMWALWFLATAGPWAIWGLSVYLLTRTDFDALSDTFSYLPLVGAVIGVLQSLVLRKYVFAKWWWAWGLLTWVGWLVALVILGLGAFFSVGVMMNPDTFDNSPILQCIWLCACGIAGWAIGTPQSAYFRRYLSNLRSEWIAISVSALMFGGFIGRLAGTIAYKVATGDRYIYHDSPGQSMSTAIGITVAGMIFGAITGGMLIWVLQINAKDELYAQIQDGSDAIR